MTTSDKKRTVVSYENMSPDLVTAFMEKYPKGYNDYLQDLVKYDKPDGSCFYAVTLETDTAIALVKIKVKTDDVEEIERWLDGEADEAADDEVENGDNTEALPDDNINQYSTGDDDGAE